MTEVVGSTKLATLIIKCQSTSSEMSSGSSCSNFSNIYLQLFNPDDETLAPLKGQRFISIKSHSSHSYEAF